MAVAESLPRYETVATVVMFTMIGKQDGRVQHTAATISVPQS